MRSLDRELRKYKEILFVDGYNIINSWENLKETSRTDLEATRGKLISILEEYQHYTSYGVVLVFDSYNVKNDRQIEKKNKLLIVYTREFETADHFIERMVDLYGRKKVIKVATSDRLEQDIILAKGATRISAKELEIDVQNSRDDVKRIQELGKTKNKLHFVGLNEAAMEKLEKLKKEIK